MGRLKRVFKKVAYLLLAILIIVFTFLYFATYSSGVRAGVPTKFSKKGIIFKTYEGTLNVGGLTNSSDGAIPTTWDYSVKNSSKEILEPLNDAMLNGSRVKLHYKEKYFRFLWQGDTKYFVYKVEILK